MAFTTNDGDSAFLAAFAAAQEYQAHAEDAPPALLLEQALWGDDDENDVDGEEGDELMANDDDDELLMIPELVASDDTQSDSASAPPTDHTQYPQMQVASLPNRRNLARRSRKKMFKYKPNRARDGRREELVYLSKKVSELEAQLETLKRRQGSNNTSEPEVATLQQPQRDSSAVLTTSDASSQNSSMAASVWQEIASRQSEERSKAEKDNIRLKLVLEHQIKIAKSLESVLHKKLSTKVSQVTRSVCTSIAWDQCLTITDVVLAINRKSRNAWTTGVCTSRTHPHRAMRRTKCSLRSSWRASSSRTPRSTASLSPIGWRRARARRATRRCARTVRAACSSSSSRTK